MPGLQAPSLQRYEGKDGAYLCESGEHRYFLQIPTGREGNITCLFLMLNPGTERGVRRKAIERERSALSSRQSGDTARCGRATSSPFAILIQPKPSAVQILLALTMTGTSGEPFA